MTEPTVPPLTPMSLGTLLERHLLHGLGQVLHRDRLEVGEPIEYSGQRVVEHVTVVHSGADDDLAAHLDAVVEQCPEPSEAHAA